MSRVRVYLNGKPDWSDNEPGFVARVQGYGGAAIGTFEGVTLTAKQRRRNEPKRKLPRQPFAELRKGVTT